MGRYWRAIRPEKSENAGRDAKPEVSPHKKALMVAYGFPPIAYAGTHRTLRFCKYLPGNGWMPTVLTIKENHSIHNDFNLLKKIPREVRISRTREIDVWRPLWRKFMEGENVEERSPLRKVAYRCRRYLHSLLLYLFSIPDHMLLWVPFAVVRGIALERAENFDVVYSTSPPHSEHLAALLIAKMFRKRWIVDFRDPLLDNFTQQDVPAVMKLINRMLEKLIVSNADRVIVVTDLHCQTLAERYPSLRHKFLVIKNGFDPELFRKLEPCVYNKFTILYAGSLYGSITPDFFLQGLKGWIEGRGQELRDDVQVLFYGFANRRLETLSREMGLEDVVKVYNFIPQEEIIRKQKGAHLLLMVLGFDEKSRGVISSKVYEYLASGTPILAIVPFGDALKVISCGAKHYHVVENDYQSLSRALDAAYEDYLGNQVPCRGEGLGHFLDSSEFSAAKQVRDLAKLFNETLYAN